MCAPIGVDPLSSKKGFWDGGLSIGEFYYEFISESGGGFLYGKSSIQEWWNFEYCGSSKCSDETWDEDVFFVLTNEGKQVQQG